MLVRIAANLDELKRNLSEGRNQIETTTAAMSKLATSFQGDRLIQQAHNVVAAVNQIGGASKLTEAEQARVNATLEKALAKYAALGREAPAAMRQLADETKRVPEQLSLMDRAFGTLGSSIAKIGAAIAGAFAFTAVLNGAKKFIDLTGELTDMAAKTGIGTTALQKLKIMAEQSGGSLDQVTGAITKMGAKLVSGDQSTVSAMGRLGLSIDAVRQMQPDQAFATIADKIATIQSPMERAKVAMDLFGKSGAELLPMMTGNLAEMGDKAEQLGLILDEETIAAGDEFGDTLGQLMTAGMAIIGKVLGPFLPLLSLTAQALVQVASVIGTVLKPTMEVIVAVGLKVREFLIDMIGRFIDFASKIPGVSSVVSGLKAGFDALKGGAINLHQSLLGVEQKSTDTKKGLDGVRYALPPLETNTKALAKATRELADAASDLVERGIKRQTVAFREQWSSGVLQDLNAAIRAQRQEILLIPPVLTDWVAKNRETTATLLDMVAAGKLLPEATEEQIKKFTTAGKALEAQDAEMRGLIETIGRFAGEIGGSWGTAIANMVGGWMEGAAAADAYEQATTKAGKAMAIAQGAMAVWHATSAQSKGAAIGGGALAGAQAGSMFGPYGAAIGAAAGAMTGWIRSMSAGRDAVKDFANTFEGGFSGLQRKLGELGAEGEQLWVLLTQGVGRGNPQEAEAAIRRVTAALDKHEQTEQRALQASNERLSSLIAIGQQAGQRLPDDMRPFVDQLREAGRLTQENADALLAMGTDTSAVFKTIESDAQRFGVSLSALGPTFQQQRLTDQASDVIRAITRMTDYGGDLNGILAGTKDEINAIVIDSMKFGLDIPANMKPWIEKLLASGELLDENGQRIQDISQLKFGGEIEVGLKDVVDHLKEMVELMRDRIPEAISRIPTQVRIDVNATRSGDGWEGPGSDSDNYPGFATGTHGQYLDFGAGTPVMLHGRERVTTEAEGRAEAGRGNLLADALGRIDQALRRQPEMIGIALRDALAQAR